MKLVWTSEALEDRESIYDHIQANNPRAALRLDRLFAAAARRLIDNPAMGRPGPLPGTRKLVAHPHYVLIYDVIGNAIRILRVLHTARKWP